MAAINKEQKEKRDERNKQTRSFSGSGRLLTTLATGVHLITFLFVAIS